MPLRLVPKKKNPYYSNIVGGVVVTLTAEVANSRTATITLKDSQGRTVSQVCHIGAYLSDVSTGIGIAASAPNGNVTIGATGAIISTPDSNKSWALVTNATGTVDLVIGETTAKTFYLIVRLPDGTISATAVAFV